MQWSSGPGALHWLHRWGFDFPKATQRNQGWHLSIAAPHSPSFFPFQVEKSLQRIQNGQRNAMYTSQQSVENKVGGIPGWQALLTAVGFRLDPPASGLPAAVFFPTSDPGDRLQQCSSTIQSLLGEPWAGRGRRGWWLWRLHSPRCWVGECLEKWLSPRHRLLI